MTHTLTSESIGITITKACLPYDNDGAQERLIRFLTPSVLHVVMRWLENPVIRRLYEKDDMMQDCFLTIFRKVILNFKVPHEKRDEEIEKLLCRYVINSLNNHWRDALRTANRRLHLVEESVLFGARMRSTKDVDGLDLFGKEDTRHDVHERDMLGRIRQAVSPRDFKIAYLRYQGSNPEQIARILGVSGKTVRTRLKKVIGPVLSESF